MTNTSTADAAVAELDHLRQFLCDIDRQHFERVSESLSTLADRIEALGLYAAWADKLNREDDLHVREAFDLRQRCWNAAVWFERMIRELERNYLIDTPSTGRHLLESHKFLTVGPHGLRDLQRRANDLAEYCRSFLTAAARHRGILGAGEKLSDSTVQELWVAVKGSAPPPAPEANEVKTEAEVATNAAPAIKREARANENAKSGGEIDESAIRNIVLLMDRFDRKAILHLAGVTTPQHIVDIFAAGVMHTKKAGKCVKRLIGWDLASRSNGERGGAIITPLGRTVAKFLEQEAKKQPVANKLRTR